jgi:hypothetical protein
MGSIYEGNLAKPSLCQEIGTVFSVIFYILQESLIISIYGNPISGKIMQLLTLFIGLVLECGARLDHNLYHHSE